MKLKQKKGISLIVLVITIIVLIILATAIILTLNSNNIVGRANEAKLSSDRANIIESATVEYAKYDLKTKTGKLDSSEISAEEYVKDALKKQGISKDDLNLLMVTDEGNIFLVKIPNGFVASDISTEDEIEEGLVIYEGTEKVSTDSDAQTTRNQYVWVPVPDINEFVRRDGYSKGVLQTRVSGKEGIEPYKISGDTTGESAEYEKMRESVEKHGGFYIARYEAGTTNKRTDKANGTSFKSDGITPDVLSQKDKYVYNYVGWAPESNKINENVIFEDKDQGKGAVQLSRSIYPENSNSDVVSTLCYGVQYDAAMKFVEDIENPLVEGKKFIEDSTSMGWYSGNKSGNSDHKTGIDLDSGKKYNMQKNIYDMAGNVWERTMEAASANLRYVRGGGNTTTSGYSYPASVRYRDYKHYTYSFYGFRVALYLK